MGVCERVRCRELCVEETRDGVAMPRLPCPAMRPYGGNVRDVWRTLYRPRPHRGMVDACPGSWRRPCLLPHRERETSWPLPIEPVPPLLALAAAMKVLRLPTERLRLYFLLSPSQDLNLSRAASFNADVLPIGCQSTRPCPCSCVSRKLTE
jgi:hypothetical protein